MSDTRKDEEEKKSNQGFGYLTSASASSILGIFLLFWPLLFVYLFQYSCKFHNCSLSDSLASYEDFFYKYFSVFLNFRKITFQIIKVYFSWVFLQLFLYLTIPGRTAFGQKMPSGRTLSYKCNGLLCFLLSNIIVIFLSYKGFIKSTYFVDNISELLILSNICGIALTVYVFFKAIYFPNNHNDCYNSNSVFYNIYMGIEHSPRILNFDFKQFFNARTGIALWPLINLSYAAKQYEIYGRVTNSMIIVNILQFLYVMDLFINEAWYMKTIDIAYDHFGYYLAWGDLVWLPFMYTLQGFYLVYNPVVLSPIYLLLVLLVGLISFVLFRLSNSQKDQFRQCIKSGKIYHINGRPCRYIVAFFTSSDGKSHISHLLADGFWGISRHFNYFTDMINSLCYCLPCGFAHILPYFYFFYMIILLTHRTIRDDMRCKDKYKQKWEEYCAVVPYRIIPYIY